MQDLYKLQTIVERNSESPNIGNTYCVYGWKDNVGKMAVLSKLVYRLNASPNKITVGLFA